MEEGAWQAASDCDNREHEQHLLWRDQVPRRPHQDPRGGPAHADRQVRPPVRPRELRGYLLRVPASTEHAYLEKLTEAQTYAGFDSLLEKEPAWRVGSFPLRDGTMRELREPDAVTIVQNGRLRVGVARLTRSHDR